jgi:hypothetical protein
MGVEFALLTGAMLAGEGSMGGVGCPSAFSALLLSIAISAFIFAHMRSISGSMTVFAEKKNFRPWMNPSIIQIKPKRAFSRSPIVSSSAIHLFLHHPRNASMVAQVSRKHDFLLKSLLHNE